MSEPMVPSSSTGQSATVTLPLVEAAFQNRTPVTSPASLVAHRVASVIAVGSLTSGVAGVGSVGHKV
jgi:hypothetical protein